MPNVILGGLLGILGTLVGVWFTFRLKVAHDARKAADEDRQLLVTARLDLENQRAKLDRNATPALIDVAAFELLKTRGVLARLPTDVAVALVRMHDLLQNVNAQITAMHEAALAIVQSGKTMWSMGDMRKDVDAARTAAAEQLAKCVALLAQQGA